MSGKEFWNIHTLDFPHWIVAVSGRQWPYLGNFVAACGEFLMTIDTWPLTMLCQYRLLVYPRYSS